MGILKKTVPYLILILLSIFAILPLFQGGYFPMHDDTQPARIYEMAQALSSGQFPVRWVADLGYGFGYPIFNFYSPLPYYFGAALYRLGIDIFLSTKLIFAIGMLFAPITMFLLVKKIWNWQAGLVGAILYMYAPYHAVEVFVRGAVGEYWAYGILPLVFWGLFPKSKQNQSISIAISGISFAAIILSHNITALLLGLFLGLWFLLEMIGHIFKKTDMQRLKALSIMVIMGLGLSAFFWLPAIFEAKYTKVEQLVTGTNDFRIHFVNLDQLWSSPWGYAGSGPGRSDGMSFMIGKPQLILGLSGLIVLGWYLFRKKQSHVGTLLTICGIGFIISVLMMLSISLPVWESFRILEFVQYPWRFLVFAVFFMCLVGGIVINLIPMKKIGKFILVIVMISALVVWERKYFKPQYYSQPAAADYIGETALRWNISKISDEYLPKSFLVPAKMEETIKEKIGLSDAIMVRDSDVVPHRISVSLTALEPGQVTFAIANFPGWEVVVDGQKIIPDMTKGLVTVPVIDGDHHITAYFVDTPVRSIGNWLTAISLVAIFGYLLQRRDGKETI